jgi:hypothetical protein
VDLLLAICLGIALSAACGFRVFIPPFAMSLAAVHGNFELSPQFAWLGTYPATIALGVATVVEILAYYIPVIDNLLDTIEIPIAIAVGIILTAAIVGDLDSILQWSLAVVGGGAAGIIGVATTIIRLASTGLTGGVGNIGLATMEALSAAVLSLLALTLPLLAIAIVIGLLIFAVTKIVRYLPSLMQRIKRN